MNTPKLRALTVYPEWAWAECHLGKDNENRPPSVAKMVLNVVGDGWLAIHAGANTGGRPGRKSHDEGWNAVIRTAKQAGWEYQVSERIPWFINRGRKHGGEVPVVRCHGSAIVALCRVGPGNPDSPWAVPGQAQIGLRDLFVLPEPVPCSGKQGLWTVSDEVTAKVYAQLPQQEQS